MCFSVELGYSYVMSYGAIYAWFFNALDHLAVPLIVKQLKIHGLACLVKNGMVE